VIRGGSGVIPKQATLLWLRRSAGALLLIVAAFGVVTARAVVEGERAMRRSDAAFDRGELREAIVEARRAAILYAPGAPHVAAAYTRLEAIATGAESAGQRRTAAQAWRAVRAAALETRHVRVVYASELERANRHLARLEADALVRSEDAEPEAAFGSARVALERDDAPRARWILALLAGFLLSAAGLVLAVWRGLDAQGRLTPARGWPGLLVLLAGVVCWTVAVYRA
jgi:hypothetical protein